MRFKFYNYLLGDKQLQLGTLLVCTINTMISITIVTLHQTQRNNVCYVFYNYIYKPSPNYNLFPLLGGFLDPTLFCLHCKF